MPDIGPFIRTDYKTVDKRDEVRNVLGWIRGDSDQLPVIVDEGKPFGLVSDRALLGRRIDPKTKMEGFVLTTRAVSPEASVADAMERMAEFRTSYLPVEDDKGEVAGYVAALDLIREQRPTANARDMYVPVSTLTEEQSLSEAHHLFNQEYVDYLPVKDKEGQIAGVIRRRVIVDMVQSSYNHRGRKDAGGERVNPLEDSVHGYLDTRIPTIKGDADFAQVMDKVEKFGCAIVKGEGNEILGIITAETIVQKLARKA